MRKIRGLGLTALIAAWALSSVVASAQSVMQSGSVTPRTIPYWLSTGVIGGGITAVDSPATGFSVSADDTPALCVNSARQSAAGRNTLCLSVGTSAAAKITLQNYGTAVAQNLEFVINGTAVTLPTGGGSFVFSTGVTAGDHLASYTGANAIIQDSGVSAAAGIFTGGAWQATPIAILYGGTGATTIAAARTNLGLGSMALQASSSVAITGGTITGMPTPSAATDVAIKSYVDSAVGAGIKVIAPSALATAAVLPNSPTYGNGASGVGATLTAGSNTTLTVDGTAAPITTVVLVKNQASAFQNGIYTVTQAGDGSNPWILTRATYFDQAAEMTAGSYTFISSGATNINKAYVLQTTITTVGTDSLVFNQFGIVGSVTGGASGIVPATTTATLYGEQMPVGGRVSLASGSCVSTTDQIAQTIVYYAPCGGGKYIPVYDGTDMKLRQFTASDADAIGLSLTLGSNWAASTGYDLYAALDTGTLVLCTVAWSNSGAGTSARATAIALFKGVWTNNASMTCRKSNAATVAVSQNQGTLVGGFITSSSTGQVDLKFGTSASGGGTACVCIWNVFNQVRAAVAVLDSTTTWFWTQPFHQANASAGNQINVFQGLPLQPVEIYVTASAKSNSAGHTLLAGIGVDVTNVDSSNVNTVPPDNDTSSFNPATASYTGSLAVGYHFIARLEQSSITGTTTWVGVNAGYKTGLTGKIWY